MRHTRQSGVVLADVRRTAVAGGLGLGLAGAGTGTCAGACRLTRGRRRRLVARPLARRRQGGLAAFNARARARATARLLLFLPSGRPTAAVVVAAAAVVVVVVVVDCGTCHGAASLTARC